MKKILAALILAAESCPFMFAGEPILMFPDGRDLNMGLMEAGESRTDSLRIRNGGDSALTIFSVYSDCSCSVPVYPQDPIEPGNEAWIKVTFNSRGRAPGGFLKILRVKSDAPSAPKQIYVKGEVKRPIRR